MRPMTTAELEARPWLADRADPLTRLLLDQDAVIALSQARQHLSRGALRHRVESGRWRQIHREVFVAHAGPIGDEQRLWVATLAAGDGAVVGGRTSLALHGMKGFPTPLIHLALTVKPAATQSARRSGAASLRPVVARRHHRHRPTAAHDGGAVGWWTRQPGRVAMTRHAR